QETAVADRVAGLVGRIESGPTTASILIEVERERPDARLNASLKAAFEMRSSKQEKQSIAVTLLRIGETDEKFFKYLADYVREAVESSTPTIFKTDQSGHIIRGEFSAAFLNWCATQGKDPKDVAQYEYSVYPGDVHQLALANDKRSLPLFMKGLESN